MELASTSKHSITPEQVRKDNSDIWRYSTILFKELRKEKFAKADPASYIDFCDAAGMLGGYDPFDDVDFALDVEKFKGTLSDSDADILTLFLIGMRQREIEDVLGIKQRAVSGRLTVIFNKFRDFYLD